MTKRLRQRDGLRVSRSRPVVFFLSPRRCVSYNAFPSGVFLLRKPTQPAPSSPPVTVFPPNWIRVPQRDYKRKQWSFKRLNTISFSVGGRPGVNMGAALRKTFTDLDGRDDPMLQDASGAISCRLLVGLLWFSIRPPIRLPELTASKVPRLSCKQ